MLIELEEVVCPHCRTPRDDMELEEGRALIRKEELRLKRRPKIIAARVIAAILLASAWFLRGFVTAPLGVAWREFQAEVEKTQQPSHWKKDTLAEPIAASDPPPAVVVSSFVYLNANTRTPQDPVTPPEAVPEAAPSPPPPLMATAPSVAPAKPGGELWPGELRVQGSVYDLATALPVPNVKVRFELSHSDAKWEATTDGNGRYQVSLYKNASEAITVMIEAPGYRKGLLEDSDPPYRERSAPSRAALIKETTDSDLEPVPLRYKASAQIVELDLALIPQVKN
jgi:hypothetical protein